MSHDDRFGLGGLQATLDYQLWSAALFAVTLWVLAFVLSVWSAHMTDLERLHETALLEACTVACAGGATLSRDGGAIRCECLEGDPQ